MLWRETDRLDPNSGRQLLRETQQSYGTLRSYRDRGTLVTTLWKAGAARQVDIAYFDTLFRRGTGVRFRVFDEQHRLQVGLWHDGRRTIVFSARGVEDVTLEQGMSSLRGVAYRVADLVLPWLRGQIAPMPPTSGAALAGIGPVWCGRCRVVALLGDEPDRQESITIEENTQLIRRYEAVQRISTRGSGDIASKTADTSWSQILALFEGEKDISDDEAVQRELRALPSGTAP